MCWRGRLRGCGAVGRRRRRVAWVLDTGVGRGSGSGIGVGVGSGRRSSVRIGSSVGSSRCGVGGRGGDRAGGNSAVGIDVCVRVGIDVSEMAGGADADFAAVLMVQAQLATQARGCRAEVGWGYRAALVRSPRSTSVAHKRYYQLIRARCRQGQQIQRWSRQPCRRQRMRRRR